MSRVVQPLPGSEFPATDSAPDFCVVSRRNDALGTRRRWMSFAALACMSFGLALALAVAGAWLVLPYSVLEIAVLAAAFAYIERRSADWERLTVTGDRVVLERSACGRRTRHEWNRPWLRVNLDEDGTLRLGREAVDFGSWLPAEGRREIARSLRQLGARR